VGRVMVGGVKTPHNKRKKSCDEHLSEPIVHEVMNHLMQDNLFLLFHLIPHDFRGSETMTKHLRLSAGELSPSPH